MSLLQAISFCVFFILIRDNVNCVDGGDDVFKNVRIIWDPEDKPRFEHFGTDVTARNLRDVVPKITSTWGRFSVRINDYNKQIFVLKKESITDINNLTKVSLSDNNIRDVEPGALRNLPQLEKLDLSCNKLTEIKSGTFANLTISVLDLDQNSISVLQPGAFQRLPNLKVLFLTRNRLRTLPNAVLDDAVNLQYLALMQNSTSRIESEAFKNLASLKTLLLNYNELTELNCGMLNLPQLDFLVLNDNSISSLDSVCFKNLHQLRDLRLRRNNLREIPAGLLNYSKIEELDLGSNKISVIAQDAFHIPTLQILMIDNNKLKAWDSRWLRSTPKLLKLYAAGNEIEELPDEALRYCSRIDFANNRIKSISPTAFRNLKIIYHLNLNNNKIENWDINFLNNITVYYINVHNNRLQCIDGDLEEAFGGAGHVQLLNGNPWRADCQTKIDKFQNKHGRLNMWYSYM